MANLFPVHLRQDGHDLLVEEVHLLGPLLGGIRTHDILVVAIPHDLGLLHLKSEAVKKTIRSQCYKQDEVTRT